MMTLLCVLRAWLSHDAMRRAVNPLLAALQRLFCQFAAPVTNSTDRVGIDPAELRTVIGSYYKCRFQFGAWPVQCCPVLCERLPGTLS